MEPITIDLTGIILACIGAALLALFTGIACYGRGESIGFNYGYKTAIQRGGVPVEAHVRLGKDSKYGILIGEYRAGTHDFAPDFLLSVQDRKDTPDAAFALIRRFWPHAMIVQGHDSDHPDAGKELPMTVQAVDPERVKYARSTRCESDCS